jgi:hypothetical protein
MSIRVQATIWTRMIKITWVPRPLLLILSSEVIQQDKPLLSTLSNRDPLFRVLRLIIKGSNHLSTIQTLLVQSYNFCKFKQISLIAKLLNKRIKVKIPLSICRHSFWIKCNSTPLVITLIMLWIQRAFWLSRIRQIWIWLCRFRRIFSNQL